MDLFIKDRLFLPQLLPQQNTFKDFTLKSGILKKTSLTTEDQTKYEIKHDQTTNQINWNIEKDRAEPLSITFTPDELEYIKKGCENFADNIAPDDLWALVERLYEAK